MDPCLLVARRNWQSYCHQSRTVYQSMPPRVGRVWSVQTLGGLSGKYPVSLSDHSEPPLRLASLNLLSCCTLHVSDLDNHMQYFLHHSSKRYITHAELYWHYSTSLYRLLKYWFIGAKPFGFTFVLMVPCCAQWYQYMCVVPLTIRTSSEICYILWVEYWFIGVYAVWIYPVL